MFFLSISSEEEPGGAGTWVPRTSGCLRDGNTCGETAGTSRTERRPQTGLGLRLSAAASPAPSPPGGRAQPTKRTLPLRLCVCCLPAALTAAVRARARVLSYREGGSKTHGGPSGLRDGVRGLRLVCPLSPFPLHRNQRHFTAIAHSLAKLAATEG